MSSDWILYWKQMYCLVLLCQGAIDLSHYLITHLRSEGNKIWLIKLVGKWRCYCKAKRFSGLLWLVYEHPLFDGQHILKDSWWWVFQLLWTYGNWLWTYGNWFSIIIATVPHECLNKFTLVPYLKEKQHKPLLFCCKPTTPNASLFYKDILIIFRISYLNSMITLLIASLQYAFLCQYWFLAKIFSSSFISFMYL